MRKLSLSVLLFVALFVAGCSGGGGGTINGSGISQGTTPVTNPGLPPDNVTTLATFDEIEPLTDYPALVRINREGTEVLDVPVLLRRYIDTEQLVFVEGDGSMLFGPGDSGSPVVTFLGGEWKLVGALAYGNSDETEFYVQPAWKMNDRLGDLRGSLRASALGSPLTLTVPAHLRDRADARLAQVGQAGRVQAARQTTTVNNRGAVLRQADNGSPVRAGQSVQVDLVRGPLLDAGIVGTITLVTADRLWLFGHDLYALGAVSLPLSRAEAYDFVANDGKYVEPTELQLGELFLDTFVGSLANRNGVASTFTLTNNYSFADLNWSYDHQLANSPDAAVVTFLVTALGMDDVFGQVVGGSGLLVITGTKGNTSFGTEIFVQDDEDLAGATAFEVLFYLTSDEIPPGPWQDLDISLGESQGEG